MLTKRLSSQKSKLPQEEQLFYVQVKSSLEVRRDVLLASKNSLDLLRKIESLKDLKKEKENLHAELHHVFEQLIVLNKKLT